MTTKTNDHLIEQISEIIEEMQSGQINATAKEILYVLDRDRIVEEIDVLRQIREAVGDPEGKLMQDELVERVKAMAEENEAFRDGRAHVISQDPVTVMISPRREIIK